MGSSDALCRHQLAQRISRHALVGDGDNGGIFLDRFRLPDIFLGLTFLQRVTSKELTRRISGFCKKYDFADQTVPIDIIPAVFVFFEFPISDILWELCETDLSTSAAAHAASLALPLAAPPQMVMDNQIVVVDNDGDEPDNLLACSPSSIVGYVTRSVFDLVAPITKSDRSMEDTRRKVKVLQQTVRRQAEQVVALQDQLDIQNEPDSSLARARERGERCNLRTAFAIAIRRNLAHVGIDTLGSVCLVDLSHQSVSRCECKCGTALRAHSVIWREEKDWALINTPAITPPQPQRGLEPNEPQCDNMLKDYILIFHRIRADATNGGAWQRMKLFNLEYLCAYFVSDEALKAGDLEHAFTLHIQYADLQIVIDGSTAGALGLRDKQLEGLGAPGAQHRR